MTAITAPSEQIRSETRLRAGTALMAFGAPAFVGYAVTFFILNFTDRFLVQQVQAAVPR